jgi:hypothetical protein
MVLSTAIADHGVYSRVQGAGVVMESIALKKPPEPGF